MQIGVRTGSESRLVGARACLALSGTAYVSNFFCLVSVIGMQGRLQSCWGASDGKERRSDCLADLR